MIVIKSHREIDAIRCSGKLVAQSFKLIQQIIKPGITTIELNDRVDKFIRDNGAIPAFKGYNGFPASICTSINDEVVHGIPCDRVLKEGDIVSIDIGVLKDGYYSDAAVTFGVGKISEDATRLLRVTQDALYRAINKACVGNRISDISHTIETTIVKEGFSVVRELVGHGIGRKMHEEPQIPNFGQPGFGPLLKPGMVLAIEPMVNSGQSGVITLPDNWTVVTQDRSLSAHFEHTVAISANGPEVLTID